jgi:hypothetical protein
MAHCDDGPLRKKRTNERRTKLAHDHHGGRVTGDGDRKYRHHRPGDCSLRHFRILFFLRILRFGSWVDDSPIFRMADGMLPRIVWTGHQTQGYQTKSLIARVLRRWVFEYDREVLIGTV